MRGYRENAKWLTCLAPFRALSIGAAYLTPFFLEKGLSLSEVFLLQSAFSLALLLSEVPTGMIADRFGRALSIKVSVPLSAAALLMYGLSSSYWQFLLCELALAVASSLHSGSDTALLIDSLKAEGCEGVDLERRFVKLSQRINAVSYASIAAGVPIAFVLVTHYGPSSTILADGIVAWGGVWFALRLAEAPRGSDDCPQRAPQISAWQATKDLSSRAEVPWLVGLGAILSVSTYIAFWLSAPYYESMGVTAAWFGVILAGRSLWKAALSHWGHPPRRLERNLWFYAGLTGLVYMAMASGQVWLALAVIGHDVIQALHGQPITARLNAHMDAEHRATVNSGVNLVQRLVYTVAGPIAGWLVDTTGLSFGFVIIGLGCSILALVALGRLRQLGTFRDRT